MSRERVANVLVVSYEKNTVKSVGSSLCCAPSPPNKHGTLRPNKDGTFRFRFGAPLTGTFVFKA